MKITEAIQSKTPPLGLLVKAINNGEIFVRALVVHMITDLVEFINAGKTMNPDQITQTAAMIITDYNWLKVEDIKVCFTNGKRGHYGQLYDRLDGQIIFQWLNQYTTDRTNESLRLNDLKRREIENPKISPEDINPEGQKKVIEILSQYSKKVDVRVEKRPVEKTEVQKLAQRFFTQFDKIWMKRGIDTSGCRFIFMYCKKNDKGDLLPISSTQYAEYKFDQIQRIKQLKNQRIEAKLQKLKKRL